MTREENFKSAMRNLSEEQKADVLRAIISWITGDKIAPVKSEWELAERYYNRDMVYVLTQILIHIK